jgi:hypothetical protein
MADKLLYGFTAIVLLDRTVDLREITVYGYTIAESEGDAHEKINKKLKEEFYSTESLAIELLDTDVVIT